MAERHVDVGDLRGRAQIYATAAATPIDLAVDGKPAGIIAVADPIEADSRAAIERLQHRGMRVVMLPEVKKDKVAKLQAWGEIVGMTGDGINDAPALALANVGFAIGTGTGIAIESADITLMRGSLHGLADAIAISRATLRNIKQNLFGAFVYNVLGIPIAAGVLYPWLGVLLNPIIAGGAMALSSVTVVSNANRLRGLTLEEH